MSDGFFVQQQTYNNSSISTDELIVPIGNNLNSSLATKTPFKGAIGYDQGTETLYYGTGTQWLIAGTTGSTGSTGSIGSTGSTGLGTSGSTGQTGRGATGGTGGTGSQGTTGNTGRAGQTGLQGVIGNTGGAGQTGIQGSTGATGVLGAQDSGHMSFLLSTGTITITTNADIVMNNYAVSGTVTTPTANQLTIGTSGVYLVMYGYGLVQGSSTLDVPQSFGLAVNGVVNPSGAYNIQEDMAGNIPVTMFGSARSNFNSGGQSAKALLPLIAGNVISLKCTLGISPFSVTFVNDVFNNGRSTLPGVTAWVTILRVT